MLCWAWTDRINRVSRNGRIPEVEVVGARGVSIKARDINTRETKARRESKEIGDNTRTHGHIPVKSTNHAISPSSGLTRTKNPNTPNEQYCERFAKSNGLNQAEMFSTGKITIHKSISSFSTDFDLIGDNDPHLGLNKRKCCRGLDLALYVYGLRELSLYIFYACMIKVSSNIKLVYVMSKSPNKLIEFNFRY